MADRHRRGFGRYFRGFDRANGVRKPHSEALMPIVPDGEKREILTNIAIVAIFSVLCVAVVRLT